MNPGYEYPIESLRAGSSLGNPCTFARLDKETNLKGLWSSIDDQFYAGEWIVDCLVDGRELPATHTLFYPESQITVLTDGTFTARKQFFLPYRHPGTDTDLEHLRAAIYLLRFSNTSKRACEFVVRHTIVFPATPSDMFTKQPSPEQLKKRVLIKVSENRFDIVTIGNESETRMLGSPIELQAQVMDETKLVAESKHRLAAGENIEASVCLTFAPDGLERARKGFERCRNGEARVYEDTVVQFRELLARCSILTPEPTINRGIQWAKVNTARVQHNYRLGRGFTNDPPQDIVVVRDVAWYVFGSDFFTPEFSHDVLALCERHAFHEGGKLTEYFHANENPPRQHDYNLNINDDTPLFVLALAHHAALCDDGQFLERIYPLMKKACYWILTQLSGGLIWCTSNGTNVWGICSWRNIIDGYTLSGAVTEINAECYAALRSTADAADRIGKHEEAMRYHAEAEKLRRSINTSLISEKTGMYLLNIGTDGVRHHDVTGDLIFPVMFGVADPSMRERILNVLTSADMWTPLGARTVSPRESTYDPDSGCQLVGGIWPNLMAWIAFSLRDDPDKLVEGMRNIFSICEVERPVDFVNVVPGQFPERLHGLTYQSRGMTLSPWMPPTYIWLAVEGLLGMRATSGALEMNPALPPRWKWIAVKDLPYRGGNFSAFLYEGILYSTHLVVSSFPVVTGASVQTASDDPGIFSIGLQMKDGFVALVAAEKTCRGTVSFRGSNKEWKESVALSSGEAKLILRVPQSNAVGNHAAAGKK